MALLDPITQRLSVLRYLRPKALRELGAQTLSEVVIREIPRAKKRVSQLEARYPSADKRELSQRLLDEKKGVASMVGGVSGVFGLLSVPADLLLMAYLELVLLIDVATLYKVNLKAESDRSELLDLFGETNGIGPLARSGPRAFGGVAAAILRRAGMESFGRAMPVVAAPVSAWLNHQHIQRVGEAAMRHYEGFGKARKKRGEG